jgi:hypothetical protein
MFAVPSPISAPSLSTKSGELYPLSAASIALGVSQLRQERDVAAKAVKGQVTVESVITVEESSFLVAMQRVISGIKIQDDLPTLSGNGFDSFFDYKASISSGLAMIFL